MNDDLTCCNLISFVFCKIRKTSQNEAGGCHHDQASFVTELSTIRCWTFLGHKLKANYCLVDMNRFTQSIGCPENFNKLRVVWINWPTTPSSDEQSLLSQMLSGQWHAFGTMLAKKSQKKSKNANSVRCWVDGTFIGNNTPALGRCWPWMVQPFDIQTRNICYILIIIWHDHYRTLRIVHTWSWSGSTPRPWSGQPPWPHNPTSSSRRHIGVGSWIGVNLVVHFEQLHQLF